MTIDLIPGQCRGKHAVVIFFIVVCWCAASLFARETYSPNDADCRGADDSESIQRAVDAARASGVGRVVVPAWNARTQKPGWTISRAILLPGGTTVVLDGCHLTLADDVYENFFRSANVWTEKGRTPAGELRDIRIIGLGNAVLDGGKANDLNESTGCRDGRPHVRRNCPILFANVREFAVTGLKIVAHRYWGMCFCHCRYGRIADCRFVAGYDRRNQDGINLRNGCSEIVIENISGQSGDDMIALSAIDSPRTDGWSCLVEGRDDDIHDVAIRNVTGAAVCHPLVALRNSNGAKLYNIAIENVSDTDFADPCRGTELRRYALVRIGNGFYWKTRRSVMGEVRNISVRNLAARFSDIGVVINTAICDSTLSDIACGGACTVAVSTAGPDWAGPGAAMANVVLDRISMSTENGEIFDPSCVIEDEKIADVVLRDCSTVRAGRRVVLAREVVSRPGAASIRLIDGVTQPFVVRQDSPRVFWRGYCPGAAKFRLFFATAEDAGGKPGKWSDLVETKSGSHLAVKAGGWVRYRFECVPDGEKVPVLQFLRCGDVLHTKWRSSEIRPFGT